jgi:hypothetical protein
MVVKVFLMDLFFERRGRRVWESAPPEREPTARVSHHPNTVWILRIIISQSVFLSYLYTEFHLSSVFLSYRARLSRYHEDVILRSGSRTDVYIGSPGDSPPRLRQEAEAFESFHCEVLDSVIMKTLPC